ncbi:SCO1860 family LAETG-anchored protein [Streptomyces sp. NPDC051776]|uniref:SCO1860 family LAETG-anchored protein n=1 Tax=Streptomyces sp. NPDC051776 TaxID=3155414 RepID=UPI003435565C
MNSSAFSMPARRAAAVLTVTVLTAGSAALIGAVPAYATDGDGGGKAGAVVLRTGLDVNLLSKSVHAPLNVALNEVDAPASENKTALTAKLDGVDHGKPFSVLRADVATARATTEGNKAKGYANLVRAKVNVPGLPLRPLIEVEQVTSKAVCQAGEKPTATSNVLGTVRVLGKKVTLSASGTTEVKVLGVGKVRLDLSKTSTTSRSAAATALELAVAVNPGKLNVAEVKGKVTLVRATCESPSGTPSTETPEPADSETPAAENPDTEKPGLSTQTGKQETDNLAETGGSSSTPYLAGGAALLIAAGGGAVVLARRRRQN